MANTLIPTARDLSDEGNAVTARLELDRATDRNDDAALAAWARRWGYPALQAADEGRDAVDLQEEFDALSDSEDD